MRFGISIFPTDYAIPIAELAPAVKARGFDSLWVSEHTHLPVSRQTPYPGYHLGSRRAEADGELPRFYKHTLDPFVALTAAAMATSTLKLATGMCLLVEHDPIDTAKRVSSVDHLSNGRVLFGIGGGWNRREMENHGTRYESRWKLLRERVEAMKEIWTRDEPEYHGEFVDFDSIWMWPKPVQKPHPPVIVGGNGPRTLRRVVRYGDGWCPNRGDYLGRIPELRRLAAEAGRREIPITANAGAADQATIERHLKAGVERCVYWVPAKGRDAALRRLEELTQSLRPYVDAAKISR